MKINLLASIFILLIISAYLIPAFSYCEGTVPAKIFLTSFTAEGAPASIAFIFEENARSILDSSTNLYLLQDYDITNYLDVSNPVRFINLNNIHGLINGKLSKEKEKYVLQITAINKNNETNLYQIDFLDIDEGLAALAGDFKAWVEKTFPRVVKKMILEEEIETVTAGKYEYVRPTLIFEVGGSYSPLGFLAASTLIQAVQYGADADISFRYDWWGFNLGGSYYTGSYSVYAGPELNFLKGLMTLTAGAGYMEISVSNSDSSNDQMYNLNTDLGFIYLSFYIHFSDFYSVSIGGMAAPFVQQGIIAWSYYISDNRLSDFQFSSYPFGIYGGYLKCSFNLTPDFSVNLRYTATFYSLLPDKGSGILESGIELSFTYKLALGGENE